MHFFKCINEPLHQTYCILIYCLPVYTFNYKLYANSFSFSFQMWIYVTWIFWLGIHASWYLWLLLIGGSVPLWICFLQSWRGDPGIITATHEDKLNVLLIIPIYICKTRKIYTYLYL